MEKTKAVSQGEDGKTDEQLQVDVQKIFNQPNAVKYEQSIDDLEKEYDSVMSERIEQLNKKKKFESEPRDFKHMKLDLEMHRI